MFMDEAPWRGAPMFAIALEFLDHMPLANPIR